MRILLSNAVVSHGAFHHWMTSDLRALGHEVSTIDPDELCEQFGIELWRRVCLQRIAVERPHVFMVYPPYDLLRPEDHDRINALGTVVVGFAYDDPIFLPSYKRFSGDFERIAGEFLRTYDVYLTTSREFVAECERRGIGGFRHIRWACNTPADDGTLFARPRDLPLVVIGAPYPRRVKMVKHLKDAGVPPAVFGAEGWKQFLDVAPLYHGMLTRPGMFDTYRRARIALAPADWESNYTPMVKLRSLEIAVSGPLQIIEEAEDLDDYYQRGTEIVSYRAHHWEELAQRIRYYLAHDEERTRIARAGYDRTLRDHVWQVRWAEVEALAVPVLERIRGRAEHDGATGRLGDPATEELKGKAGEAGRREAAASEGSSGGADQGGADHGGAVATLSPPPLATPPSSSPSPFPDAPPATYEDSHLPHTLGVAACALHYERLGDSATAMIAYQEWQELAPDSYTMLLGMARVLMGQNRFPEAEHTLLKAVASGKSLCPRGVDSTVTQRKLGPRNGLGRLFTGIFPRTLEAYSHLLILYSASDQRQKAEDLLGELSAVQDLLFVAIVAILAEPNADQLLRPQYLGRYVEVLLTTEPNVWAGEKARHMAHFWMLRGQALASQGNREEGKQCLEYALTQSPYPQVETNIRKQLALLG